MFTRTALSLTMFLSACVEPAPESEFKRIASQLGTLYVNPNAHPMVTGGVVQYRIYENGDIFYSGDISYFGGQVLSEVQIPFSGRYRALPQDVQSASYRGQETSYVAAKMSFDTESYDPDTQEAILSTRVVDPERCDSPDATGTIRVDLSGNIIKILEADLGGTIFPNYGIGEMRLRLHLDSEPFADL